MSDVNDDPVSGLAELDRLASGSRRDLERSLTPPAPSFLELQRRVRHRRQRIAGVLVVIGLASGGVWVARDEGDGGQTVTAGPASGEPSDANADLLAPGASRVLPPAPITGRGTMASVWTGQEMIIWGGDSPAGQLDDGARYNPRTNTWRKLPAAPLSARNAPAAVWTGREMVLWGGHSADDGGQVNGAAFDPETDTWRTIADAPIVSQGLPTAVWAGSEMIVLAGFNGRDLAAYNPAADTWRTLASAPGQPTAPAPQMAWTGDVVVTRLSYPGGGLRAGMFAYDPAQDQWQELPTYGDEGSQSTTLAWTGNRLLAVPDGPGATAAVFDFETAEWTGVSTRPDEASNNGIPAWTGSELLMWSGDKAAVLNPASGAWATTPAGDISNRVQPAAVWADGVFIVWGGFQDLSDGLVLRPASTSTAGPQETVALPPSTGHEPDLVPVAGSDGTTPGTIDQNGPPATWNGRILPLLPVEDEDGNLVGYFGCRFLERNEVERDDFDPASICPTVTTTMNG